MTEAATVESNYYVTSRTANRENYYDLRRAIACDYRIERCSNDYVIRFNTFPSLRLAGRNIFTRMNICT